jgi:glycosyltransferase involved in cell wall biosynthesis
MLDRDSDFKSTILYTRKGGFSDLVKNRKSNTIFIDEKNNSLLKSAFLLKEILEKLQPTIVHTHGYDSNYLVSIYKILQKILKWPDTKCAFVATTHGWIKQPFSILLKTYYDYLSMPFFDGIVVVEPNQLDVVNKLKKKSALAIHMKTAVRISSPEVVRKYSKDNRFVNNNVNNDIHISFVGRLSPEKRVDLAIEVYKEILKLKPNWRCSIIGSGSQKQLVTLALKENNKDKRIVYKGYQRDIEKEFHDIDILLIVSDSEGCPRVALEAMSTRTIVVSRPVGYMKNLIGKNERGLLLSSINPPDIAKEIIEFVSQSKQKINGILLNAEQYVVGNHSPKRFVDAYIDFYKKAYKVRS